MDAYLTEFVKLRVVSSRNFTKSKNSVANGSYKKYFFKTILK